MDQFEKFYNKALRFLSFRPRSEKEIRDYLIRHSGKPKVHPESDSGSSTRMTVINRIIAKLKEQKFVNDEEFAKWWIEQRTNFKPRSLRLIKMELKQKGIDEELVQGSILRLRSGQSDLEMAKKLVQKRLQKYKNLPRQEIYQKLGRVLAQKGFSWDTIKESIDGVLTGEYN